MKENDILNDKTKLVEAVKVSFNKKMSEINGKKVEDYTNIGRENPFVKVRTNDTIPKSNMTSEEERPINNFYTSVPTFTINETPSNTSGNKAFAEVLIVAEILALIILVTLVTFVAFYGLS